MKKIGWIFGICILNMTAAMAAPITECLDRGINSHFIDITAYKTLGRNQKFSTTLNFKNFRSFPVKLADVECMRPQGNGMTGDILPALVCESIENSENIYHVVIEGPRLKLEATVYDDSGNILQRAIPCKDIE
jgi:hypothetical protein